MHWNVDLMAEGMIPIDQAALDEACRNLNWMRTAYGNVDAYDEVGPGKRFAVVDIESGRIFGHPDFFKP